MPRTAFVSGAAGGLGRATTEHLVAEGWQVLAGDLPGPRLDELVGRDGIVPVAVDVTDPDSVAAAGQLVPADGLDGVVTFAGVLRVGSLAEVSEQDMGLVIDVNLLGTYRVVRAMFDHVVARRGRIVVISSETGWQTAAPFNGPYAVSKHAVDAYADALRREAALLGVHVAKVQPGPFRTEMVGGIQAAFDRAADASTHFAPLLRRMGPRAASESRRANDPEVLARVVHRALTTPRRRARWSVRPDRLRTAMEWLPDPLADRLVVAALARWMAPTG